MSEQATTPASTGTSTSNASNTASSNATATIARPAPVQALPPWRVLLHNDEVNEIGFVIESLCRFARLSVPAATRCTMEAHKKGLSMVLATHREHAELIAEQLSSLRIKVTIEPGN